MLGTTSTSCIDEDYLNLVEKFWATALQTLQAKDLDDYVPRDTSRFSEAGANVALPIAQRRGWKVDNERAWTLCFQYLRLVWPKPVLFQLILGDGSVMFS